MVGGEMGKKNRTNYSNRYISESKTNDIVEEVEDIIDDEKTNEIVKEDIDEENDTKILKVVIPDKCKLAIREDPSTESKILGELSNGSQVMLNNDIYENWFGIVTESGIEGHILKDYVEFI